MPRDYVNSQHKESRPIPGWIWLLAGLFIGLFVALLVYIKDNSSGKIEVPETISKVFQPKDASSEKEARGVKKETQQAPPGPESTKPKFDFYTILPELEVAIPEHELVKEKETQTSTTKQEYILQAGSFKKFEEADRLKARLALEGIVATIQKVKINSTDTWHRVRIGPLDSVGALNKTRRRLRSLGIASIVVKNKS